MKAILYALVILVIGGAATFSYTHSKKFEALQKDRLQTIEDRKKEDDFASATIKELITELAVLAAAEQKKVEITQQITDLKSKAASMEREIAELDSTLKGQDEEFAELDKTMKEVQQVLNTLGDDTTIENLAEKIQQVTDLKKSKEDKLDELKTLVGAADKLLANNRSEVDRLVKRDVERDTNIGHNSVEAVLTSVSQDWGFVVIGAGSITGFSPQSTLLVKRDGRVIGRVRPSSIEPSQTIAEIDFASLAPGVRLQPGDHVMPAKPITN